ncbi:hypothetical protein J3R83DRAFT_11974 [Lanmaoa asiatica]|nr:hypothetical protein J3R83DRAFT_11974 [Lanmaoa asiatica]
MARKPESFRWRLIPDNDPELTFVFKYQPLSVLQANGIAPRSTSNGANTGYEINSSESNVGTVDDPISEDIKPAQLNDRIQNLENELKRLRDLQHSESENQKPKRVKREERSQPIFAPGQIIVLT